MNCRPKARPPSRRRSNSNLPTRPDEAVGQTLGRYKLLEKVGEGGCGVVYVAEQTEPVRRRVALKVIKLGMDTKAGRRPVRGRAAGAGDDGPSRTSPRCWMPAPPRRAGPTSSWNWCAASASPITATRTNLTTKERLDLFIKVCQAIQHAHQKGIIHRDIKPSNILVTLHDGVPVPKVIDFGIAKATEGRLTDATVYTQLHQFIGTPAYMSPEQAEMSGLDIDTRSDIYSLGVLLYELLAGSTPFDAKELMSQGIDAMRKTIREKEPVRPSTRFATLKGEELTTTAKRRSADKSKLMHQLKGDLDWIVMKCLEKDRTRRYETANGLAADLKRHLNNEPVVARPPSSAYRLSESWFGATSSRSPPAAAIAAALLLGIIVSTWQAVAGHARQTGRAVSAAASAEASESRKPIAAQANEAKLREQAEAEELAARQRAYASDMNVAAAGARRKQSRPRAGPAQPAAAAAGPEGFARLGMALSLAANPQRRHVHPLPAIHRDHFAGGFSRRQLAGGGCAITKADCPCGICGRDKSWSGWRKMKGYVRAAFSPAEPLLAFTSSTASASGERTLCASGIRRRDRWWPNCRWMPRASGWHLPRMGGRW